MDESSAAQMELRPHHCGISVPDLEASIAWYRDVLGFSLAMRGYIKKANAEVAFMKHGDSCIELFEVEGAESLPDSRLHPDSDVAVHGTKHIAFEVQDISKLREIRASGDRWWLLDRELWAQWHCRWGKLPSRSSVKQRNCGFLF